MAMSLPSVLMSAKGTLSPRVVNIVFAMNLCLEMEAQESRCLFSLPAVDESVPVGSRDDGECNHCGEVISTEFLCQFNGHNEEADASCCRAKGNKASSLLGEPFESLGCVPAAFRDVTLATFLGFEGECVSYSNDRCSSLADVTFQDSEHVPS